jgi:Neuraminidase (sialidase)
VDLPLPPAIGANGTRFGSDPSLAYDTIGNVFYSYIVVFFSNGKGKGAINGTEMATARSGDGGATYPNVTYFSFSGGQNHFNDKPMIAADTNLDSAFRDNVYVAWDAATGGSSGGGIRVATSTDHGASFSVHRVDNPTGPGRAIGAVPFVGSQGEVYVAWNDYSASTIAFNRSFDGGNTWGTPTVISGQSVGFQALPPAQSFRGALLYPTCSADRSAGPHRGRVYCAWMDGTGQGTTDIVVSFSADRGASWSAPVPVTDQLPFAVDRFFPWLSVDPVTGDVNVAFYDTRNDTTGFRYMTDVYLSQSRDGGVSWRAPNTRVSSVSSNEHDCAGVFPCNAIDYGNQYGDYLGLVSHGGVSHPVWTDSRDNQTAAPGCRTDLLMEEVFTATVQ